MKTTPFNLKPSSPRVEFMFSVTGNPELMEEIWDGGQHIQFSYLRVLKLLYSNDKVVRLLAGAALATFSYNNMQQQQLIAAEGGITFNCFMDFLKCEEEYFRCCAAFQVNATSPPTYDHTVAQISNVKHPPYDF